MSSPHLPNEFGTTGWGNWTRCALVAAILTGFAATSKGGPKDGYTLFHPTPASEMRELSTDRPDQTESPYTVDAGHFQVELDAVNLTYDRERKNGDDTRTKVVSIAPVNFKVGLTNQMDLQLMVDPSVSENVEDVPSGSSRRYQDFGDVTLRLKYNFWGNDGGATAFGLMPFVKLPLRSNEVRNGDTECGLIAMLAFEAGSGWSGTFMTEVDSVSSGDRDYATEWVNSLTFSHDLTSRLGGYVEFFTVVSDASGEDWQGQVDGGLTFALTPNTQLDLGCNFGVTDSAPDYQPFIGFSQRF